MHVKPQTHLMRAGSFQRVPDLQQAMGQLNPAAMDDGMAQAEITIMSGLGTENGTAFAGPDIAGMGTAGDAKLAPHLGLIQAIHLNGIV